MSYKKQKVILVTTFLFVPLLLLIAFTYLPLADIIWYSLNDWNGLSPMEFCGFDNYIEIFTDPEYFSVLFQQRVLFGWLCCANGAWTVFCRPFEL